FVASTGCLWAQPAGKAVMKPGLWEIVTVNETPGVAMKRTTTARACYTAEDVSNIARILPQQREPGMKCESRDTKAQGATATWKVACSGKDAELGGNAKMTMAADNYSAAADLELKKHGAKPVKVEQKVTAKWIEACK
ncbi:MAG TPA: DUF3617 family protein, partial [Candidatus Margulisiibacteriota bacterium]|nr:DUF3617 family protein [Candidatus Margulisiibacteriota bacterium]